MLTLRLKQSSTIPLEVEGLLPEKLAGLNLAEIERLPLAHGNRTEPVAEWFDVAGNPSQNELTISGDCGFVKRIGERITSGRLVIEGNAGMHVGAMMKGGSISVSGNSGDWLGAEMSGGKIEVRGNAGHQVGAAYRGSRKGMRGGTIIAHGNAGDELGLLMRRGLIAVRGSVGSFCGASMIAGTIAVFGGVGPRIAAGMKRGTIIVKGPEPVWPPGVTYACEYQPAFARLILNQLQKMGFDQLPTGPVTVKCHRADLVTGGKGEVWSFW